jgi:hypothetical protein
LLIAFSTVLLDQTLVINLYVNMFTSLTVIKFYYDFSPLSTPWQNRIEKTNEAFLLFSHYCLILFTDFIPDVEFRYKLGFKAIAAILMAITFNISLVFWDLIKNVRLAYL